MKTKHLFLFIASLLLIIISSCDGNKEQNEIIKDHMISMELSMPEDISAEGVKGSIAYYWHKDLTLHLMISQEGKANKVLALTPKSIPADGKKAHFDIELNQTDFDLNAPVQIQGAVAIGKDKNIQVNGGKLFAPKGYGNPLPYDILKVLNQPLLVKRTSVSLKNPKSELKATLKPQGQLIFLQVHNGSAKRVIPKTITFTSNEDAFINEKGLFIASSGMFEGKLSKNSIDFAFPEDGGLSPELAGNYIVWLPTNRVSSVDFNIIHTTEKGIDITNESPSSTAFKGSLPLIYINLTDDGDIEVDDEPLVEEADTSEGGDPFFSMNDIEFWIGEGQKRAALVIEWHDDKHPDALVWGYRWDGDKTGLDMIKTILAADPRLSMLMGKAFGGLEVVGGIGYQFTITQPRAYIMLKGEKLPNDGKGITYVDNLNNISNYTFSDLEGHWKSGWKENGYWVYYTKNSRLESWSYAPSAFNQRNLEDGCWDGWSFQNGMDSYTGSPLGSKFTPASLPNQEIIDTK